MINQPNSRNALKQVCNKIQTLGAKLRIVKDEKVVAKGWDDPEFAVGINEVPEAGHCEIIHYEKSNSHPDPELAELITAQAITAEEYDGVIEESISHEKDLKHCDVSYRRLSTKKQSYLQTGPIAISISHFYLQETSLSYLNSHGYSIFRAVLKFCAQQPLKESCAQKLPPRVSTTETTTQDKLADHLHVNFIQS